MSFLKFVSTPPCDAATCTRTRKRIAVICASVLATTSIAGGIYAIHTAPDAAAASLIETDLYSLNASNKVPKQEIILDGPLNYARVSSISTTGALKWLKITGTSKYVIYQDTTITSTTATNVSGTGTVRFNNCGQDRDGNRIDAIVTISNISVKLGVGTTFKQPTFLGVCTWSTEAQASAVSIQDGLQGDKNTDYQIGNQVSVSSTIRLQFVRSNNNSIAATGTFISGVTDLDVTYANANRYSESLKLYSGINNSVYVLPAAQRELSITENNTRFTSNGTGDNSTYKTGLVYIANADHTVQWKGNGCGTVLFLPYNPYTITAKAEAGGTITNAGAKTVGWKNEPSYTVTASTNYKIKSLVVDSTAVSVPANSKTYTYKFSPLYANHTITATFEKISTTLSYNKNLASATGATASQTAYAGTSVAARQNGFVAEGKHFREWNTKPDGTGTRYAVGATVPLGESPITLYAQWDDIYNTITETHTQGGTMSPAGATSVIYKGELLYNIVPDEGYLIQEVLVDGNKIDISPAADGSAIYKFASVVANHTIHVSFKHVPLTVRWIDALTGEEVAVSSVEMGDDAAVPDIPSHRGHRFICFSGGDWHNIVEDQVIYINYSSYAYCMPSYGAARYNGFTFSYKV